MPAPESATRSPPWSARPLQLARGGAEATILFSLSGHGLFDLAAYEAYLDGTLPDQGDPGKAIAEALRGLPEVQA